MIYNKFRNYVPKYPALYVFAQDNNKSLNFVGVGNKWEFNKYGNYVVRTYNDNNSDKTSCVILSKN